MNLENILTPQEFPKDFSELPLNVLINFHLLGAKNDKAEIMNISKEDDCIRLCPARPSSERFPWLGCRSIKKEMSNEEFEALIENLKSAGWRIEINKDNEYVLHF